MSKQKLRWLSDRKVRIGCIGLLVLVVGGKLAIDALQEARQRAIERTGRENLREQIAQLDTNPLRRITLSSEVMLMRSEMTAFVKAREELSQLDPYELQIWYSQDVDGFLKQIAAQPHIRSLILYKTDVTVAGIESIATLPEIEKLYIAYIRETTGGSSERLSNVRLKSLVASLKPLENAPLLKELILVGEALPSGEIEKIGKQLPRCTIQATPPG